MKPKLSDYCIHIKPYVEKGLDDISKEGYHQSEWNSMSYECVEEYLDDCVIQIVSDLTGFDSDVNLAEAMRLSGIVDGYLTSTNIMSKVIRDRNPLGGLFK